MLRREKRLIDALSAMSQVQCLLHGHFDSEIVPPWFSHNQVMQEFMPWVMTMTLTIMTKTMTMITTKAMAITITMTIDNQRDPDHTQNHKSKTPQMISVQFYTFAADVSSSFWRRLGSSPWLLIVSSSETFQSGTPRCSNIYISPFFVCHHHHRGHLHQLSSSSSWLLLSSEPSWLKFDWFDCSPLSNILLACFNFWLLPPGSS